MCLAVPGRIVSLKGPGDFPVAVVDFQGTRAEVGLALVPDARRGDWVLVHAGFALSRLDEADARETWEYLEAAGLVEPPGEEEP